MATEYRVRDYNTADIRDAERLVDMFSTFDSAWPGGFNRGAPQSVQQMFESMQHMLRLATCVVEHDDRFVGYCDLHAQADEKKVAYVPLLGADPAHHGKGVGRMLMLEIIRRTAALGFREVTLHTWGGNLKAMPLYKKVGFHWVPESEAFMRNFVPGLLNSPAGKTFFAGRNWYLCHERALEMKTDDVIWNGMKVFPYSFRDPDSGEYLKAMYDRTSGGLTALETGRFSVSCCVAVPESEAPAGIELPAAWTLTTPGRGEALLIARGDDGINVNFSDSAAVDGKASFERMICLSPDAEPRRGGEPERCIRSTVVLNGETIELETGIRIVRPIEIEYSGQGLLPGRDERIRVRLTSNLDRQVTGRLSLDPHPNLAGTGESAAFTLPPRLSTHCEFSIRALAPGACITNLRYRAEAMTGARPVSFAVYDGIEPITSIDESYDEVVVQESPGAKLTFRLRGGRFTFENRSARHSVRLQMPNVGPPFGWRQRDLQMQGRFKERTNAVVLRAEFPEMPGIILERSVRQLAGDLLEIDHTVFNVTDQARPISLRMRLPEPAKRLAFVVEEGLIRENRCDWGHYPSSGQDTLREPDDMKESWLASETGEAVTGIVWHGKARLNFDWFIGLTLELGELQPHSSLAASPVYIVNGGGGWCVVRDWWKRLVQPSDVNEREAPEPRRVLRIRTDPSPLLLSKESTECDLIVENARGVAVSGNLTVSSDDIEIEPANIAIEKVNRDSTLTTRISARDVEGFGAGTIRASLVTTANTIPFKLPVIRIGSQGEVTVQNDGAFEVRNGILSYRVAPEFLGSITSLVADGQDHLHSAWPTPRPFVWTNPWFGGIHPFLNWAGDEALTRETFSGEPTEHVGSSGLAWRGVHVTCRPNHRSLRGFEFHVEYLTLPLSDLICIVSRTVNLTDAPVTLTHGVAAWMNVGGSRAAAVAHWSNEGEMRHRNRGGFSMDIPAESWCAVENPESGHRIQLVAGGARVVIDDMSEEGPHMSATTDESFEPNETRERIAWIVVNPAVSEFDAYSELKAIKQLP